MAAPDEPGAGYGYGGGEAFMQAMREEHYPQLQDETYLDFAGTAVPSKVQLKGVFDLLQGQLLGNPHSPNPSSQRSTEAIDAARRQVLAWLGVDGTTHDLIFTAGSTAALKLVGESFPFTSSSVFRHTTANHTSVLGIRHYAAQQGAAVHAVPAPMPHPPPSAPPASLFAYSGESNFSGAKLPHSLCLAHQAAGWLVLLDASALVANAPLDLSLHPYDFVAFSFHKIFGYPSGLGALVVRKPAARWLRKGYFGGGTVTSLLAAAPVQNFRQSLHERFEDGTVAFSSIAALPFGFRLLSDIGGMAAVARHLHALTQFLFLHLTALKHANGSPLCHIYGDHQADDSSRQGPIVAMSLRTADGAAIPYSEVEAVASLHSIHLRTGCFCNAGECHEQLAISPELALEHMRQGHECWDDKAVIGGMPTGAVRVSLGFMSTAGDCLRLVAVLRQHFLAPPVSAPGSSLVVKESSSLVEVSNIVLYPVKSCGGMEVARWPLGPGGLLHDRQWALLDESGRTLGSKSAPTLLRIRPELELERQVLVLRADGHQDAEVPMAADGAALTFRVFGEECQGVACGKALDVWCSEVVGRRVRLVRKEGDSRRCPASRLREGQAKMMQGKAQQVDDTAPPLSLANESQLLLTTVESVAELKAQVGAGAVAAEPPEATMRRFRPNLVVKGALAYDEDMWECLESGTLRLTCLGPCARCRTICVDPATLQPDPGGEPLQSLMARRRVKGRAVFGRHVAYAQAGQEVWQGMELRVARRFAE